MGEACDDVRGTVRYIHGDFGRVGIVSMRTSTVVHAHADLQLVFNIGPRPVHFRVDDRVLRLGPSAGGVIGAWSPHHFDHRGPEPAHVLLLHLRPAWLAQRGAGAMRPRSAPVRDNFRIDAHLERRVGELVALVLAYHARDAEVLHGAIAELVGRIGPIAAGSEAHREAARRPADHRIRRALELLEVEPSCDIDFGSLARECGISRPHFFSQFRKILGISPKIYANSILMKLVIARLSEGEGSIRTISDELGFSNPGNFSRFFRMHLGIAPRLYRQSARVVARRQETPSGVSAGSHWR